MDDIDYKTAGPPDADGFRIPGLNNPRKRVGYNKECEKCRTKGLSWKFREVNTDRKYIWKLFDKDGKMHSCEPVLNKLTAHELVEVERNYSEKRRLNKSIQDMQKALKADEELQKLRDKEARIRAQAAAREELARIKQQQTPKQALQQGVIVRKEETSAPIINITKAPRRGIKLD